jgi:hypothetical protein
MKCKVLRPLTQLVLSEYEMKPLKFLFNAMNNGNRQKTFIIFARKQQLYVLQLSFSSSDRSMNIEISLKN